MGRPGPSGNTAAWANWLKMADRPRKPGRASYTFKKASNPMRPSATMTWTRSSRAISALQVLATGRKFLRRGLVVRRRATGCSRNVDIAEREAIAAVGRGRLVRKARTIEGAKEEIAGAVAGEDAASAVPPMCSRGQANDQHASLRVAPPRDRTAPVLFVPISAALNARGLLTPGDQARTEAAGSDLFVQSAPSSLIRHSCERL